MPLGTAICVLYDTLGPVEGGVGLWTFRNLHPPPPWRGCVDCGQFRTSTPPSTRGGVDCGLRKTANRCTKGGGLQSDLHMTCYSNRVPGTGTPHTTATGCHPRTPRGGGWSSTALSTCQLDSGRQLVDSCQPGTRRAQLSTLSTCRPAVEGSM